MIGVKSFEQSLKEHGGVRGEARFPPYKDFSNILLYNVMEWTSIFLVLSNLCMLLAIHFAYNHKFFFWKAGYYFNPW
jgi:hypothetical protein